MDTSFKSTTLPFCPREYIQRVNYQVFVWIHSMKVDVKNGEEIEYDLRRETWSSLNSSLAFWVNRMLRGCTDQDMGNDDGDDYEGVDITSMVDEVFDDETDED